jgi:hypothetical protein
MKGKTDRGEICMPRVVMFLGAGASRPFGIPTMKEFVLSFEDEIRSGSKDELKLYLEVKEVASKYSNVVDLETIFSILEGLVNGDPRGSTSHYGNYYYHLALGEAFQKATYQYITIISQKMSVAASLRQRLEDYVAQKCKIPTDQFDNIMKVYGDLFTKLSGRTAGGKQHDALFPSGDWAIFTTNYDTCIESFCRKAKIDLNNCFFYNTALRRRIPNWDALSSGGLKLIKLHGSINWSIEDDGLLVELDTSGPSIVGAERFVGRRMIYPVDQKLVYQDPFLRLYHRLLIDLASTDKWIIIGYSFNDPIVTRMFIEASSSGKKMVYVHPEADSIAKERLASLKFTPSVITNRFGENGGAGVNDTICQMIA